MRTELMNSKVSRTAWAGCSPLLTSSGWSSGLPLPHIPPAISPPAVSVSKTSVWSQALPDEKPSRGTETAAPSGNLPEAGGKARIFMGIRMRVPREMPTGRSLAGDSSGALTETFCAVSARTNNLSFWPARDGLYWLSTNFIGSGITSETNIWASLWRIIYTRIIEVGRAPLTLGSSIPQAGVLVGLKRKKASRTQTAVSACFQTVDAMWPAAVESCCHHPCRDGLCLSNCQLK